MLELKSLEAVTTLSMEGVKGPSPTLRMRLHGPEFAQTRAKVEEEGVIILEASRAILEASVQGNTDSLDDLVGKAVASYRSVIDTACGQGTSGKVIKWMAKGEHIEGIDLIARLAPIVGWIADQVAEAFDGLAGQDDDS